MSLAIAAIFIILGILTKYGKLYFLIAGYNTMPKEDQKKYDIKGIATVFRNAMFGMALLMLLGFGVSKWLNNPEIESYAVFVSIIIGVPYLLIASNSGKYKMDKDS
ncbi:DUF3784 domain-containing protein [Psychroserpens sp. Hel_I_66]|uniref:DUF3784 domain-containing protein n=1 Tax=Psychroserpens sp. Hel_I_66 TaxID=1250004 RepID=UPI0006472171|nr:DUF3784 domain-containing protein [Psychroserpens sp. Hel_I_66]